MSLMILKAYVMGKCMYIYRGDNDSITFKRINRTHIFTMISLLGMITKKTHQNATNAIQIFKTIENEESKLVEHISTELLGLSYQFKI